MYFIVPAVSIWFVKAIKFGIVGGLGLMVDFGTTYLLKERLRWNKFVANSAGFSLAVVQNYFLNRIWTFNNTSERIGVQFSKFLLVAIIGLLLNNTLLLIFLKFTRQKYFYVSKASVTCIVFIWNFFANSFYTFK